MSVATLRKIEFHSQEIQATQCSDGRIWVVLKRLCENLGISAFKQREKLKTNPAFEGRWHLMVLPSSGGEQETFCIDLDALALWLGSISAAKVKRCVRDRLISYQRECMAVLREHFFGSPSPHEGASYDDQEAALLRQLEQVRALKAQKLAEKEEKQEEQGRTAQAAHGGAPFTFSGEPYIPKDTPISGKDLRPIYECLRVHSKGMVRMSESLERFYYDVNGATNFAKDGNERSKEAMIKAEEALAISHALRDERDNLAYAMKGLPGPGQLSIEILPLRRLRSYVTDLVIAAAHHEGQVKQKVWNDLFAGFLRLHRVDLKARARNKEIQPVDYAEQFGFIEKLYELAYVSIALKYHPAINKTSFPLPRA